ncbi:MAG TPA: glycosyltransferase [Casimicrobiaceae bacterium]|nr:glycosyltransferase [Casimicrobiaceae bacterium]
MIAGLVAALGATAWAYLLAARGGFWRARERDEAIAPRMATWPSVCAIVPARDEAAVIGDTLASLLAQDYEGPFSIVVVDDHSGDATASLVRTIADTQAAGRVRVVSAPPLAPGWTGKLSAVAHGLRVAGDVDLLLFTDADIHHASDSLRTLVARLRERRLVLASRMARLRCESAAERALVPAFVFFFQMLYPFAWVNDARRATAAAAGGCMLVNRDALVRAGGIAAIHDALIDDCALARLMKAQGPIELALSERAISTRSYGAYREIRRMVVRSAYTELRHSPWRLAFVVAAMVIVFVAPPIVAVFASGVARTLGIFAWAAMALAFVPMLVFYRRSLLFAPALPAIATAYLVMTLESALAHARGRGGEWKGRLHAPRKLGTS